ncbi:MAG: 2-(1,2-epoxy-1,2-dihydrophenyl)acetyl-CoA isomerase [Phycisphaerales bacterium]|nr:MAG: 2-(1,2-epoxy-1,2-dihydrophenyl)acetyl-CoA isomerase [Phycisphaerales bacterium]
MSHYETITVSTSEGVSIITLNRPDSLNAFNETMKTELMDALKAVGRDAEVRSVVLTGAGRAFCSGQDLADLKDLYARPDPPELGGMLRAKYNPLIQRMREMEKPILAAVNGVAAGAGASFAMACDMRIASEKASFIQSFINVGLIPDCGGTFFLPRLVGLGKAMEMCTTGEKVGAEEALKIGLVNQVVAAEMLMETVTAVARKLATLPTKAIGLTKRLLNQSFTNDLAAQLEQEAFAQTTAAASRDHREGVQAFLEKRPPRFTGR